VRTSASSNHRRLAHRKENRCGLRGFPLNVREARAGRASALMSRQDPEAGSQRDVISVSISGQRSDLDLDGCRTAL
jgi:hypothetical protein